jgi:lysine 2,3-aminomutase
MNHWNDWQWQLQNVITTKAELQKYLTLTKEENFAFDQHSQLRFAITPYLLNQLINNNTEHALRKQFIPRISEFTKSNYFFNDPLKEDENRVTNNIIKRYQSKAIYICTNKCASYCRYCTRKRTIDSEIELDLQSNITYLNSHKEIHDILLTGGDPLILSDERLEEIIFCLRAVKHIEIIRIGTRIPVTLPMRITENLVRILKKYHPLYINIHFSNINEITNECISAVNMLADGGIPLGSQTVLLKDINDSADSLIDLFRKLLSIRVKPYYLFQCDKTLGCNDFYVNLQKGLKIINTVQAYLSGMGVPHFVVDLPDKIGKCVAGPCGVKKKSNARFIFFKENLEYEYLDPI